MSHDCGIVVVIEPTPFCCMFQTGFKPVPVCPHCHPKATGVTGHVFNPVHCPHTVILPQSGCIGSLLASLSARF